MNQTEACDRLGNFPHNPVEHNDIDIDNWCRDCVTVHEETHMNTGWIAECLARQVAWFMEDLEDDPIAIDCGDPNCWDCNSSNCECECDIDVNSVSSDDYACVGYDVTFTANVTGNCSCVDWSGGGDPNTASDTCTFITHWDSPGTKTVTATPDCGDSKQKQVTIVEVQSLLPDEGTELDDGDGDPNTKLFVVCIVPPTPSSSLTVTATPNPSVAEADLPDCWTLDGGTGTGKLTRTVSKNTAGETVITCTCTDSKKETTIWVVRGEVSLASSSACDGEEVDVDLILTPISVKGHITSVQWQATEPVGVTNYGSPSGQGLTFSQRSADITEWKIDNARWYANQQDLCNDDADWELEATYEIAGSHSCSTDYDPAAPPVVFTASAALPACLDGGANPTNIWSGAPTYTTTFNGGTGLWETTVAVGTFVRDVQATSWWHVAGGTASQYYDMVKDEEEYHEQQQMENAGHVRWGTTFLVANIMTPVQANQPYTGATQAQSLAAAQAAFATAEWNEETRSVNYLNQRAVICADETEAKTAVGSSHRASFDCTYVKTGFCP